MLPRGSGAPPAGTSCKCANRSFNGRTAGHGQVVALW
jgi:hypothetical protein